MSNTDSGVELHVGSDTDTSHTLNIKPQKRLYAYLITHPGNYAS